MTAGTRGSLIETLDLAPGDWRSLFRAFGDSNLDAIVCVDAGGLVVEWNRAAAETFGWAADEAIGARLDGLIVPPDMVAPHASAMARYLATGEATIMGRRVEFDAVARCGRRFPIELAVAPMALRGATYFVARIRDIGERRRAERQLEMVAKELDHRVQNNLAVVSALARQAARFAEDVPTFVASLCERIEGFGRAHELLAITRYKGADLRSLFLAELAPFRSPETMMDVCGPDVFLPARAALTLGMCVHEQVINAVKHGALARPGGAVTIAWRRTEAELVIDWTETGGPKITQPPTRRGFGSQLIKLGLVADLGGTFALAYPETGFIGQVRIPLDRLAA